jgi:hypothetical protein
MSAGAVAAVVTPAEHAAPARRLAVGGALAGLVASTRMERRLGELAEPYEHGTPSRLMKAAKGLMAAGAAAVAAGAGRNATVVRAGAAALAAALRERETIAGRTVAVVLTGGNVDCDVFARVLADRS